MEITHYVLQSSAMPKSYFVKEAAFFVEQGGLRDSWGARWQPVNAQSIEQAREIAAKLNWIDKPAPKSVLQDWVMSLPLREQGTLLTGVRGCDLAPKNPLSNQERYGCSTGEDTPERGLTAFLRYCIMNPADEREVDIPGAFFQSKPPCNWKPSQFGHYPQHWYAHIMHCYEVVGYRHPREEIAQEAMRIYTRLVTNLHLNIETFEQMVERLSEDRIATNTVVS